MTKVNNNFSVDEQQELLVEFQKLEDICYPKTSLLTPRFKFLFKKDFKQNEGLRYGTITNDYYIEPSELKGLWQSRKELRESNVDFIVSRGKKWFYNTQDLVGNFFSEDGEKKVEVDFSFWMDAEHIWRIPGVIPAIKKILDDFSEDNLPTEAKAQSYFTEEICRKIYEKNPSKESVKQVVLGMVETLRKILVNRLVSDQALNISKSHAFKQFITKQNLSGQPISQQIQAYLKKNKNAVYVLGEKYGYIKNANRLLRYQNLRDNVRHPKEVKEGRIEPLEIYEDFRKALRIPVRSPSANSNIEQFDDHTRTSWNIATMSEIEDILAFHADPKISRKKPQYWQNLIQKGIITPADAVILQTKIKEYNSVAHAHPDADPKKVADDLEIDDLNRAITSAHAKRIKQILHSGR